MIVKICLNIIFKTTDSAWPRALTALLSKEIQIESQNQGKTDCKIKLGTYQLVWFKTQQMLHAAIAAFGGQLAPNP